MDERSVFVITLASLVGLCLILMVALVALIAWRVGQWVSRRMEDNRQPVRTLSSPGAATSPVRVPSTAG